MHQSRFNIAIDGPAGAGKSTIARAVAAELGFIYVDTGAMYRAMALYLLRSGIAAEDSEAISSRCHDAQITIEYLNGEQVVLLGGKNVNPYLRSEEVSSMASKCSVNPDVRAKLVELQQELARQQNVVMDGRDIGTVVLPDAQLKIFLTASVRVRAMRRFKELQAKGDQTPLADIEKDIEERDYRDVHRNISPLRQAEDAILVDTSEMTIPQVEETILNLYAARTGRPQVITAKTAGFCFGVQRAVDLVYQKAEEGGRIVTYGPLIHNENVVEDLKKRGVDVINTPEEIDHIKDGAIVIRSHGVTKAIKERMEKSGAAVVDATCPFVQRIHETVARKSAEGMQIIIVGNPGHAEVEGTMGWSASDVTVIETEEEAKHFEIDRNTPVCVVAQTTFNGARFDKIIAILKQKGYNIFVMDTICNATRERQSEAKELAAKADIMIVIGGRNSSNTAKLAQICQEQCPRTYYIQTVDDLHLSLTGNEKIIGITAGASTPKNIIEEVQKDVRRTNF